MNTWKVLLIFAGLALACGGKSISGATETTGDGGSNNAAVSAETPDAGDFSCGSSTCKASEICYSPPYGCIGFSAADGGTCPGGTQWSETSGVCVQSAPMPSCVSADSLNGESATCAPSVNGANCDVVTPPIPSRCTHVCRGICVWRGVVTDIRTTVAASFGTTCTPAPRPWTPSRPHFVRHSDYVVRDSSLVAWRRR